MRLMLVGLGRLGAAVLDDIMRLRGRHEVFVAVRQPERVRTRINLAVLSASALGFDHDVDCVQVDLMDTDRTASLIAEHRPDIVLNSTTLQAHWRMESLPRPVAESLYTAESGPWLPFHLTLALRLMTGVRDSGYRPLVINASLPDIVNVVLGRIGLAPTIGIGNVAVVEPAIRRAVAALLGVPVDETEVSLVMHHYVSKHAAAGGTSGGAPWTMRVTASGVDRTVDVDPEAALALLPTRFQKPEGTVSEMRLTAATAANMIDAIANNRGTRLHAPGPDGLPGGYPICADQDGVRLDLPREVSVQAAIAINEAAGLFEGIESIAVDGTVTFVEKNMEVMRRHLGYWCRTMTPHESADRASELASRYRRFASNL